MNARPAKRNSTTKRVDVPSDDVLLAGFGCLTQAYAAWNTVVLAGGNDIKRTATGRRFVGALTPDRPEQAAGLRHILTIDYVARFWLKAYLLSNPGAAKALAARDAKTAHLIMGPDGRVGAPATERSSMSSADAASGIRSLDGPVVERAWMGLHNSISAMLELAAEAPDSPKLDAVAKEVWWLSTKALDCVQEDELLRGTMRAYLEKRPTIAEELRDINPRALSIIETGQPPSVKEKSRRLDVGPSSLG